MLACKPALLWFMQLFVHDVGGGDGTEGIFDVAAFAEIEGAGGGGPDDGVRDDALDALVVVDGKCLVAGAEVDDFAFAATPGAAAAKNFAAFEPADGEELVGG